MIYDLELFGRLTGNGAFVGNYTEVGRGWQRTIAAVGGYKLGSFYLSEEDLTLRELEAFYSQNLGYRLLEMTFGMESWEGLLYEFRLVKNGREYRRTLDPEWFHNRVIVYYSYPQTEDDEQGNLAYDPGGNDGFQDDGQDFGEWETAAGSAAYTIAVTNSDDTRAWGFLGAAFTTANADDSIYVYTDEALTDAGWSGETSGKTPSSYEVSSVSLAGSRLNTGWSENTDASDEYGEMNYIITRGGTTPEAAESLRDRELAACAWPRGRKMGGGVAGGGERRVQPAVLEVSVAGCGVTLNWRYQTSNLLRPASNLISTLVGNSEFITAGRIETNEMRSKVDCNPTPQRLGDAIEQVILDGDLEGNVWQGGVYAGREFVYEQAPTAVAYYERADGVLVDNGRIEVVPSLMEAGFLLLDEQAPTGGQPPGTSSAWDDPRVGYVDEVRFIADGNQLEYHLADEDESVTALERKLDRRLGRING